MKAPSRERASVRACKALSDYIRERDNWTCYTCGKLGNKYNMDAGHLFSRRFTIIKFEEKQVHCQCVYCNKYLSGNIHEYIKRFKQEYGEEEYIRLDMIKNNYKKFTSFELLEIERYYIEKLKALEKR